MARRHKRRRGIVILVVLSLLVLFVLLVVTYVMVAGGYQRAAFNNAQQELLGVDPEKDLGRALNQVMRDSRGSGSALRGHSLLRDFYGGDGFYGKLAQAGSLPATGDQLLDLQVDISVDLFPHPTNNPGIQPFRGTDGQAYNAADISVISGFYSGCVLTVTSGAAQGLSTRIVGYQNQAGTPFFRVVNFRSEDGTAVQTSELAGASFVVNGRPFNGTGIGYSNTSGMDDDALYPNYSSATPDNDGGADECYDGVDYQNMFLALNAARIWYPGPDGGWGIAGADDNGNSQTDEYAEAGAAGSDDWRYPVIPSFHRPAIVNFWMNRGSYSSNERQISLRPVEDNFDGSNPNYDPRYGPWDVDNDGDGMPDSIWVDLGFPVQTAPDGRQYKPLFAILCTDLDGRLNLNAHGRRATVVPPPAPASVVGGTTASLNLPRGQGYGPPEISLGRLFATPNPLSNLLSARYGGNNPGAPGIDTMARVRFFDHPANYASGDGRVFRSPPDLQGELRMGLNSWGQPVYEQYVLGVTDSPHEFDMTNDRPGTDVNYGPTQDAPFTPAELERIFRQYDVDAAMMPSRLNDVTGIMQGSRDTNGDGNPDVFYLKDLSGDGNINAVDAAVARLLVTTDSYDPPVPNVLNAASPGSRIYNVSELLERRLRDHFSSNIPPPIAALPQNQQDAWVNQQVNQQLDIMLSKDLILGLRMDLNRVFGDGQDNDADGAIDDPGEVFNANPVLADQLWDAAIHTTYAGIAFNHANKFPTTLAERKLARQQFARHLYVLAMMTTEGTPASKAKLLAQWAINVVDFRDPDAIMSHFEYDADPFNGWQVDGDPTTFDGNWHDDGADNDGDGQIDEDGRDGVHQPNFDDDGDGRIDEEADQRGLVWGCERPELLVTEPLAFHERRTENLDKEQPNGRLAANETDGTPDFDQRLRPLGSCIIELYNPWHGTDTNTTPPLELYGWVEATGDGKFTPGETTGVHLNRVAPGGAPVWRILVVNRKDNDGTTDNADFLQNPDEWSVANGTLTNAGVDAERGIYFVNPPAFLAGAKHGTRRFYNSANPNTTPILVRPGSYAVAGSTGILGNGVHTIGRRTVDANGDAVLDQDQADDQGVPETLNADIASTHRIVLNGTTGQVGTVQVYDDNNLRYSNSAVIIPIDMSDHAGANVPGERLPMSLSLSEPLDGYPYYDVANLPGPGGVVWVPGGASGDGSYQNQAGTMGALDEPLDDRFAHGLVQTTDGTIANFSKLHLQRLADPTQPWHATGNPYRTVDSSLVDLTVFNGLNSRGSENIYGFTSQNHDVNWCMERGENEGQKNVAYRNATNQNMPIAERRQLWRPVLLGERLVNPPTPSTVAGHHFQYHLTRSLGGINSWYNSAVRPEVGSHPFPWLTWNNRPFVSQYELLQVPYASSYQMLRTFGLRETRGDLAPYANSSLEYIRSIDPAPSVPPSPLPPELWPYEADGGGQVGPIFGHVMNFHRSDANAGHIYRLLEYVHVPSRFAGTETIFSPTDFQSGAGTQGFHPPFNRVSNYRDPGRVNINTIMHPSVWGSILNGFTGPNYYQVDASRRGYGNVGAGPTFSPNQPTLFANPFRAPGSKDLVPPSVGSVPQFTDGLGNDQMLDIDVTLLRRWVWQEQVVDPTDTNAPPQQLMVTKQLPMFQSGRLIQASDARRNSYFRYQNLHRLGNMITTRSNVYAIWITVGYFEMEPNYNATNQVIADENHPEGLRLGQEIGIDTGEIRRHRAFYMVDRTIPVAFEPGENHNVDKCVLLRRFIE